MSEYKVGYRKPPKQTQFQAGQSGNPRGRRKDVRNFMTDVKKILMTPVRVNKDGHARNVTTQEGALMLLREKALKGDKRALDLLLSLSIRFNNEMPESGTDQQLSIDDRAILDAFKAEVAATLVTPAPAVPQQLQVPAKPEKGSK